MLDEAVLISLFVGIIIIMLMRSLWRHRQSESVVSNYQMAFNAGQESFYLACAIVSTHDSVVDYQIRDCNVRGAALLGLERDNLIGQKLSTLCGSDPSGHLLGIFADLRVDGIHQDQFCVPAHSRPAGGWMQRRLVRQGELLALTLHDISEHKVHEAELAQAANSDALTRLANRLWLKQFLPTAINLAKTNLQLLAVIVINIDDFKNINDVLGHETGDHLLQSVALRLKSLCGEHDSLARLGGDEFTMVLEQLDSPECAEQTAQRIVRMFEQPSNAHGDTSPLRVSIGISLYPAHGNDAQALMKFADLAMNAAKISGKARYCMYERHLSDSLNSRLNARKALEHAIEHDEFVLYYQPRMNAQTGAFCSMEALIRWHHPIRGLVLPNDFIPLAEEFGLITKIGLMVIDRACAQLAQWQAQRLPCLPVSINVSLKQFDHGDLTAQLTDAIQKYKIAPELIEVELTESCMMSTQHIIADDISKLHALGIKILVDDFGTGYSSLSQLQQLDLDVLKVDRAFANELERTPEGAVFFQAIISMAHALDMTVVAEGIESRRQLCLLQQLGCNEVQGFLIAPPLPASEIPDLLVRKNWLPFSQEIEMVDI